MTETLESRPRGRHHGRLTDAVRADPPEPVLSADPDRMHPRAIEMAQAMRGGAVTFRALIGEGFTTAEIVEFKDEARALAMTLSVRQVRPGFDLLSEMVEKARAAIPNRPPRPTSDDTTQAQLAAWHRYCLARNAYLIDGWSGQRERCIDLLEAFFRSTPAGPAVASAVVSQVAQTLGAKH